MLFPPPAHGARGLPGRSTGGGPPARRQLDTGNEKKKKGTHGHTIPKPKTKPKTQNQKRTKTQHPGKERNKVNLKEPLESRMGPRPRNPETTWARENKRVPSGNHVFTRETGT